MQVTSFLHQDTETYTHVLADTHNKVCAIIDPVLDYDFKSGHTDTESAQQVADFITEHELKVMYIIETHAHADHLSAAQYLKQQLGGKLVIGKHITKVQRIFKDVFNLDMRFKTDASQFDMLTEEGTTFMLGDIELTVMHVPGHTPADMAYIAMHVSVEKGSEEASSTESDSNSALAIFVGDTLFAPDVGTARCDFPGGDVHQLYHSIQKILSLPDDTQIYLCHDYPPEGRSHSSVTNVAAQKVDNVHVRDGISEAEFVKMRTERDATLDMPRLIIPSVQVNIRAGKMPEPEDNGVRYLKVPLNTLS
ncbi:MBL fold metallo-hydrolase [Psychrobacter sp. FDAARGOS_221]|uniref:MBL fold metallo-hydrolase n=1 Tax=Psychrobacter sp. FDAARGOS_221 TaxID=1975705 RepID=UPI000BB5794C|nr:MBL fold metallo-hydrolase [Psychrobacter sp. FDAARGOS_221]PNK61826.1 MBL fold metallo-hydrolase [Psychrobacter sp. FDAARGOS_221]